MKNLIPFFLLSLLFIAACKKEDDGPMGPAAPSIAISSDVDLTQAICLGVSIKLTALMKTDADIGISSFTIVKNGMETLVEETAIVANNFTFNFTYAATTTDLTATAVDFTFTVTDKNGDVATETIRLSVVAEFAYLQNMMVPDPSWDLVNNISLANEDGPDVDIFLTTEVQGCGFGCFKYRYTFASKNDTRFYPVPLNAEVSPYGSDIKQAALLDIISGITPVKELIVFSDFPEDIGANGNLNELPIVAQIRGTEEYALLERTSIPSQFIYKKREETAGGN